MNKWNTAKVILISSLGGILEFYDFVIFVLFAKILSQVFFPDKNSYLALIATFAIFAIGFFVRPIGGIILAHFGDRYGRKRIFMVTIFAMALSTILIGVIPSYARIGEVAPILLLIFRLMQGFALGGEIPGAAVYVYEHMPEKFMPFGICSLFAGVNFGSVLGALIGFICSDIMPHTIFMEYGWRIPFLIGGVLGFIGLYMRRKLLETPLFLDIYSSGKTLKVPLFKIIREHKGITIAGFCIASCGALVMTMFNMYLPTYLIDNEGYSFKSAMSMNFFGIVFLVIFILGLGLVSIRIKIKERILYLISTFCIILTSLIFFKVLEFNNYSYSLGALILVDLPSSISFCLFVILLLTMFHVGTRFSGVAICYNIGFAIFGGVTPILVTVLIHTTGSKLAPWYLLTIACIVGIVTILIVKNDKNVRRKK